MTNEFKTLRELLSNKVIIIGSILGVAGFIGLYIYKSSKASTKPCPENPAPSAAEGYQQSQEKTLVRVLNSLRKQIGDKNKLSNSAIKAIFRSQFQLSKKEFKILTKKSREERRRAINNIKQYHQKVAAYEEDLLEVHNKHLDSVLAHFKIDKNEWIEAVNELSVSGAQDWDVFLLATEAEQFEALRDKRKAKIKLDVLEDIARFKINKMSGAMTLFKEINDIEQSDLYSLIEKWIQDSVFLKFGVEIEDMNFSNKLLDEAESKILEEHEDEYCDLVESLVLGDSQLLSEN